MPKASLESSCCGRLYSLTGRGSWGRNRVVPGDMPIPRQIEGLLGLLQRKTLPLVYVTGGFLLAGLLVTWPGLERWPPYDQSHPTAPCVLCKGRVRVIWRVAEPAAPQLIRRRSPVLVLTPVALRRRHRWLAGLSSNDILRCIMLNPGLLCIRLSPDPRLALPLPWPVVELPDPDVGDEPAAFAGQCSQHQLIAW